MDTGSYRCKGKVTLEWSGLLIIKLVYLQKG